MKKIFVGNLSADTTEDDIYSLFSPHGTVRSLRLSTEFFTGKCRGFGFLEMEGQEARAAIGALDGRTFHGRPLRVHDEHCKGGRQRPIRRN